MAALEKTSLTAPVALGRALGAKRKFTDGAKVKDGQKKEKGQRTLMIPTLISFPIAHIFLIQLNTLLFCHVWYPVALAVFVR